MQPQQYFDVCVYTLTEAGPHNILHSSTVLNAYGTGSFWSRGSLLDGRRPSSRRKRTGCKPNPGFVLVKHDVIAITHHE